LNRDWPVSTAVLLVVLFLAPVLILSVRAPLALLPLGIVYSKLGPLLECNTC
jgi:hypothetical protein